MNLNKTSTNGLEKKKYNLEVQHKNSDFLNESFDLEVSKELDQNSSEETNILNDKLSEKKKKNYPLAFYIDYPSSCKKIDHFKDLHKRKLNELAEAFNLIDFDRDGIINCEDLKKTFASLNQGDITQEEIEKMMTEASKPLDFDSFVVLLGCKTLDLDPIEVLLDAFSFWDEEHNGCIPHDRILDDIISLGDKFTEAEAIAALADAPFFFSKAKKKMIEYLQFSENISGLRKMLQRKNTLTKDCNKKK